MFRCCGWAGLLSYAYYCCPSCTSYGYCHDNPNGSIISCGHRGLLKGWVNLCNGPSELYSSLDVRQIMPSFNFWPLPTIQIGNSWTQLSCSFDLGSYRLLGFVGELCWTQQMDKDRNDCYENKSWKLLICWSCSFIERMSPKEHKSVCVPLKIKEGKIAVDYSTMHNTLLKLYDFMIYNSFRLSWLVMSCYKL